MLVLGAKENERILLEFPDGSIIWVTVAEIRPYQYVQIGFDAPKNVKILREKVAKRIGKTGAVQ